MDETEYRDSPPPCKDFELLAMRYLDGLCTAEESRLLGEQLTPNSEMQRHFVSLCVVAGILGEMAISKTPSLQIDRALLATRRQSPLASKPTSTDKLVSRVRYGLQRTARVVQESLASRRRIAAVGLMLALLIACIFWAMRTKSLQMIAQREPQLIASLRTSTQAKWRDGLPLAEGAQFSEGQVLALAEGQAQVSISCGAEVVMRGPCAIELAGPNRLVLREGLLCVQLADWTNDFIVSTESVQVVDLGKQFIISADATSGAVEAHAIDGKLRVQATNAPVEKRYGLLVTEGEAIRIQPTSNTPMRLKADARLFNASLDDSRPYKPIQIRNTGRGLIPGDEDPHWRIVRASADDFGGPRYAVACQHYTNIYLPNDPAVSQWISITNPVDDNCPPNTMYTFETEFDLADYDLSTVTIVAHVLADNGVMGVRINGQRVDFKPWSAVYGLFDTYRKIEITDGFIQGVNRIQFDVWNSIVMSYPDDDNPMALRVEWQAFGRLKPGGVARTAPRREWAFPHRSALRTARSTAPCSALSQSPASPRSPSALYIAGEG